MVIKVENTMGQAASAQELNYNHFQQIFGNQPDIPLLNLSLTGNIPDYLNGGVLYRTGPGSFSAGDVEVLHWFDGYTQNHRFEFLKDGLGDWTVKYTSKHSAIPKMQRNEQVGFEIGYGFGPTNPSRRPFGPSGPPPLIANIIENTTILTDPAVAPPPNELLQAAQLLGKMGPSPPPVPADFNVGVTIEPFWPGKNTEKPFSLTARTDANRLQKLDAITLEPLQSFTYTDLDSRLNGSSVASHSRVDSETHEEFNYNLVLGQSPVYKVFKLDGAGKVTILAEITDAPPAYLHSLFITKKYVILGVWQAIIKYGGLATTMLGSIMDGLEKTWNPNMPTLFYVIDRTGEQGVVKKFIAPAHYCFHTINAWDEDDDVILEYAKLDDNSVIWSFLLENLSSLPRDFSRQMAYAARWRLPSVSDSSKSSKAEKIFEGTKENNIELPQINPKYEFGPTRYIFGIHSTTPNCTPFGALIRYDTITHTSLVWEIQKTIAGEPLFVADPNGNDELDGVLLSLVYDGNNNSSAMVALDPATMKEIGRASLPCGVIADMGFHGGFANEYTNKKVQ